MSNLLERVIDRFSKEVSNDPVLIDMAERKAKNIIVSSTLPMRYLKDTEIDLSKASKNIIDVLNYGVSNIFSDNSSMVWVPSYEYSGYIIAKMIEGIIYAAIRDDEYAGNILYIDTPILVDDYKKLFTKNTDTISPRPNYDLEILYHRIYDADYIFWNNYSLVDSNYDLSKLYEILLSRYNNCKSNMFMIIDTVSNEKYKISGPRELITQFNENILFAMNMWDKFDLHIDKIPIKKGNS